MSEIRETTFNEMWDLKKRKQMGRGDTPEDIKKRCAKLCADYLTGMWSEVDEDSIIVERVSGGLANQNYYCALPENVKTIDGEPKEVMIKLYSKKFDIGLHSDKNNNKYDRLDDTIVALLIAEHNLGPKIRGIFHDGMIMQFIKVL